MAGLTRFLEDWRYVLGECDLRLAGCRRLLRGDCRAYHDAKRDEPDRRGPRGTEYPGFP